MDWNFPEHWLIVREIEDSACRCEKMMDDLAAVFENHDVLNIVDIGCGTGSNMRMVLPKLKNQQHWLLVDKDLDHLNKAENINFDMILNTSHELSILPLDLTEGFEYLNGGVQMVTTSAFLDLVSDKWLTGFVNALKSNSTVFYGALNVCESIEINPRHPLDGKMLSAFKSHQQTDKGFGPALGPNASLIAREKFKKAGFEVSVSEYKWGMGSENEGCRKELHSLFLKGILDAVNETKLVSLEEANRWWSDRTRSIKDGKCEVRVAYEDLLAIPIR